MRELKSIFASKTVWGAVVAAAPAVSGMFGITITGADVMEASRHLDSIVTAGGALLAIYGRITARSRIG